MREPEREMQYETARRWSIQPVSHPPQGWAQIVRWGLASWLEAVPLPSTGVVFSLRASPADGSLLLTLVAAMIAEVCQ